MGSEIANVKISGYLEKKGKLRVVAGWKKYWFVLEGRLLLYYRSKEEYEAISPCKGSISLGPPCCIKPALASTCTFQIESRCNTIILKAENRLEQDKWMQAILGALNLNTNSPTRMSHFRYSTDDLEKHGGLPNPPIKKNRIHIFSRQNTMPSRVPPKKEATPEKSKLKVLEKLRKMSADSYVARSLENLSKISSKASPKLPKSQNLQRMLINSSLQSLINTSDTVLGHNAVQANVEEVKTEEVRPGIVVNEEAGLVLIDNVEYCTTNEITQQVKEIYTETNVQVLTRDSTDHNKNSVIIENPEYEHHKSRESLISKVSGEENFYDECQYAAKRLSSKEKDYSTIDDQYSVPQLPPRVKSCSSPEQLHTLIVPKKPLKRRGGTFRRLTHFGQQQRNISKVPGAKLGRTRSFVNKVLNKISAHKSSEEETQIQMDRDQDRSALDIEEQRKISEIHMLKEMQEVLNKRRQEIKSIIPSNSNSDESSQYQNSAIQEEVSQSAEQVFNHEYDEHAYCVPTLLTNPKTKESRPDLPPRLKLTDNYYHNYLNAPLPIEPFYIPRLKLKRPRSIQKLDQPQKLKTIDEILDDLDKENCSRDHLQHSKEEFIDQRLELDSAICDLKDQSECSNELLTLRKDYTISRSVNFKNANGRIDFRYSDDLNSLLEELCKVTNAPILNTNATSSLVYHPETSDEWSKLIPMRKRTYSDPDYDVPRPHSSAKFISNHPISLQSSPTAEHSSNDEVLLQTPNVIEKISPSTIKDINPSSIEEDRSVTSYTSHQYTIELPLPIFKTSSNIINNVLEGDESKSPELQELDESNEDYDSADIELQQINNQKLLNNNHLQVKKQQYETRRQICHILVEDYTYASPRSFVSFDHMINECEHTLQMKSAHKVSASTSEESENRERNDDTEMGEDEVFVDSLEPFDLHQVSTAF